MLIDVHGHIGRILPDRSLCPEIALDEKAFRYRPGQNRIKKL